VVRSPDLPEPPGPRIGASGFSDDLDRDDISATLEDGELNRELPKVNEAQPRRIEVTVG